ncbi:DCP1 domain containing protein [Trichuris trichiura]|uniref:DCP1 domain containing protein n=1 Tax=Trichuris trichiura TaxID=36087 RepID=A0A077YWQ9_TRITR|nr:DCP1 domain containing protein [Trichuris trichiura]
MAMDMNLSTVRLYDGTVIRVIHSAGHVAIYEFDNYSLQWKKAGVEGPLFVCLCKGRCKYKLFALNRLHPANFILAIDVTFDCVEKDGFLLYKSWQSVGAIWFFEEGERSKVINCIKSVKKLLFWFGNNGTEVTGMGACSNVNASEKRSDIMTLLSNAYQKFLAEKSTKSESANIGNDTFTTEELNCLANLAMNNQAEKEVDSSVPNTFDSHSSLSGEQTETSYTDTDDEAFQEETNFKGAAVVASTSRGFNRFNRSRVITDGSNAQQQQQQGQQWFGKPTPKFNIEVESFRRALSDLIREDDYFCEKLYLRYKQIMESKTSGAK